MEKIALKKIAFCDIMPAYGLAPDWAFFYGNFADKILLCK